MKDYLWHIILNMKPMDIVFLMIGSFFIGVFLTLIIVLERSKINYIESEKKPWRKSVIIGYSGARPVYDTMYSKAFVRFLYERIKGYQAKQEAMKYIAGSKE